MRPTRAMPAQAQSWPSYATAELQLSMDSEEARLGGPPLSLQAPIGGVLGYESL